MKPYLILLLIFVGGDPTWAIEFSLSQDQIEQALQKGRLAAEARVPPNKLYAWFGSIEEFEPKGFLMTKMNGLVVLAAHFALRGEEPSKREMRNVPNESSMLVSVIVFGSTPTFARDSYLVLRQGEKLIKPSKIRFDGVAGRTSRWPSVPQYQAKIVATFWYNSFDLKASTAVVVFLNDGNELLLEVDFSEIP